MSHAAFAHIRDKSQAMGSVKSVLLMIADYANDENGWICYPGIARLARDTGYSERTVRKAVREAIDLGELRVLRRGGFYNGRGQANVYQVVSDFHRQDSPVDHRQDAPVGQEIDPHHRQNRPPLPADKGSSPADNASPQADTSPQPLVKPEANKPEDNPEDLTPLTPLEGGNALSAEYRDFLEKCRDWLDGEEPEHSGQVEEAFTSLLEKGYTVGDLIAAYRGATENGTTDLVAIFTADNIEAFKEADPIAQGWKKVTAA